MLREAKEAKEAAFQEQWKMMKQVRLSCCAFASGYRKCCAWHQALAFWRQRKRMKQVLRRLGWLISAAAAASTAAASAAADLAMLLGGCVCCCAVRARCAQAAGRPHGLLAGFPLPAVQVAAAARLPC